MSSDELTTTSYAILGLLAIKPWTTYELAQQMQRSLNHFWPRASSRIYEEPKRLARLGLAKATKDRVGRRPRTTYAITPSGRRALRRWLGEPGAGPVVEFQALLKVFFAEQGTKADALANIGAIRAWAEQQNAENVAFARMYVESGGPFPERLATIVLVGKFITDFADMVRSWTEWAAGEVRGWHEDGSTPVPDWETVRAIAARRVEGTLPELES